MNSITRFRWVPFLALLWMLLLASMANASGTWRLDGTGAKELPRNFRTTNDDWHRTPTGAIPPRREMDILRSSASAQPSLSGIPLLYEKLRAMAEDPQKIYLVDLRQESHGFANGVPVSWYEEKNRANLGKTAQEIEEDETRRLNAIKGQNVTFSPLGNHDKSYLKPLSLRVKSVQTEEPAAKAAGFHYVRISATDMVWPDTAAVESFLKFVSELPEDAWLHFHCHAGEGRTTTFLVMYDILRNSDVALEDVVQRHYLLGGSDLLADSDGDSWYAQMHRERARMLRLFYRYVQEKRTGSTSLSWSRWIAGENTAESKKNPFPATPPGTLDEKKITAASWNPPPSLATHLLLAGNNATSITILGPATVSREQMARFLKRQNPKTKLNCTPEELVNYYYEEGEREGIRSDVALCQAFKETGFFNYGGDVLPEQNNFCGLGATGNRVKGARFETPRLGARAHIQHLLAYASTNKPSTEIVDPRYTHIMNNRKDLYGQVSTWVGLNGAWAVPGTYYGQEILNLWSQAQAPDGSEESLRQANLALEQNPESPDAYLRRGIAYANAGQIRKAMEDYSAAIARNPSAEIYYNRALCRENLREEEEAIRDYTKAIKLDPLFFQAWYNRANLYLRQGRDSAALVDFDRSIALVPQLANAHIGKGIAYLHQRNYSKAWREFHIAGRVNSANEVVKENQQRMMNCLKR